MSIMERVKFSSLSTETENISSATLSIINFNPMTELTSFEEVVKFPHRDQIHEDTSEELHNDDVYNHLTCTNAYEELTHYHHRRQYDVNSLWECGHVSPYAIDRIRGYLQIKHRLRNAWVGNQNGSLLIATGVTVPRGHGAPVLRRSIPRRA
jgi:hypothetical protein